MSDEVDMGRMWRGSTAGKKNTAKPRVPEGRPSARRKGQAANEAQ